MNGDSETKSEIRARIEELNWVREAYRGSASAVGIEDRVEKRMRELMDALKSAEEDVSSNIIRSHKALCKAKKMGEKEAYGNDPAVYYTLGVCGEAGEMAGAIVKAQRNGNNKNKVLEAIKSELPDVIIYSHVLAHVLDIDLSQLVNEKVEIVVQRAHDGYYGGPLRDEDHSENDE